MPINCVGILAPVSRWVFLNARKSMQKNPVIFIYSGYSVGLNALIERIFNSTSFLERELNKKVFLMAIIDNGFVRNIEMTSSHFASSWPSSLTSERSINFIVNRSYLRFDYQQISKSPEILSLETRSPFRRKIFAIFIHRMIVTKWIRGVRFWNHKSKRLDWRHMLSDFLIVLFLIYLIPRVNHIRNFHAPYWKCVEKIYLSFQCKPLCFKIVYKLTS